MLPTTIVQTRWGPLETIDSDPWISRSFRELGEFSESEVDVLRVLFEVLGEVHPEGLEVVDAGAYVGDLTIPMARLTQKVYAFEPQKEVREVLERNLVRNNITNVEVFPYALGHVNSPVSFNTGECPGSTQMRMDGRGRELGEMRTLDSFGISPQFIKADVEGMEVFLLAGARETLQRSAPLLFYERDTVVIPGMLPWEDVLRRLGYFLWRKMSCRIWNPENYKGEAVNTFEEYASLMGLAVPLFGENGGKLLEGVFQRDPRLERLER